MCLSSSGAGWSGGFGLEWAPVPVRDGVAVSGAVFHLVGNFMFGERCAA
ncbi:MAG: hypothetical protein LBK61_11515 [Spirochaetaceae bacterium]|nr:hypothetical protein [Spirochaetaceae bacterium]